MSSERSIDPKITPVLLQSKSIFFVYFIIGCNLALPFFSQLVAGISLFPRFQGRLYNYKNHDCYMVGELMPARPAKVLKIKTPEQALLISGDICQTYWPNRMKGSLTLMCPNADRTGFQAHDLGIACHE